ncbi:MAG TPA: polyketide cyclase [Ktedonobacter sp.]|nr:polyketide cyclase [Ktedonobacter sp.]
MTRIYTTAHIAVPVELVYTYVTTPGNWPRWHPSSLAASGASEHSLEVGEQCVEEFSVAGRHGKATWTVTERVFPQRWVINGIIEGHTTGGMVSYTLHPEGEGTRFEREFTYPTPGLLLTLLDVLVIRKRVRAESEQATRQLKTLLEQQTAVL